MVRYLCGYFSLNSFNRISYNFLVETLETLETIFKKKKEEAFFHIFPQDNELTGRLCIVCRSVLLRA